MSWTRSYRRYELRQQGIDEVIVQGQAECPKDVGTLIVSNHSFHYDSYVLIEAGLQRGWCSHFMTAWQVFGMASPLQRRLLQSHGCFSINREGMDTSAFRQAISILQESPHPLVLFPEGDIYHSNDRVMPFRDGAGAIPLSASKRSVRPIYVQPCAMKCFYTVDTMPQLLDMMSRLEAHIRWRPRPELPLVERIYRFGDGFLSLKEVEYTGHACSGSVRDRIQQLAQQILEQVRVKHGIEQQGKDITDQIKNVRAKLIRKIEGLYEDKSGDQKLISDEHAQEYEQLQIAMDDVFFVTQLSSYHGNYTVEKPTIERIAETIDKFEEDVFGLQAPTPRGRRRAIVRFGAPIEVQAGSTTSGELSSLLEKEVQSLLDQINADHD